MHVNVSLGLHMDVSLCVYARIMHVCMYVYVMGKDISASHKQEVRWRHIQRVHVHVLRAPACIRTYYNFAASRAQQQAKNADAYA